MINLLIFKKDLAFDKISCVNPLYRKWNTKNISSFNFSGSTKSVQQLPDLRMRSSQLMLQTNNPSKPFISTIVLVQESTTPYSFITHMWTILVLQDVQNVQKVRLSNFEAESLIIDVKASKDTIKRVSQTSNPLKMLNSQNLIVNCFQNDRQIQNRHDQKGESNE